PTSEEEAEPAPTTEDDPTDPPREPARTGTDQTESEATATGSSQTDAAAAPDNGDTPAAAPNSEPIAAQQQGGPLVKLLSTISSQDSDSAFGRVQSVLLIALGIGFLTTAGFVGATWHSRRAAR